MISGQSGLEIRSASNSALLVIKWDENLQYFAFNHFSNLFVDISSRFCAQKQKQKILYHSCDNYNDMFHICSYCPHSCMNYVSREDGVSVMSHNCIAVVLSINKRAPQVWFEASPVCDCGLIMFISRNIFHFYLIRWDGYQILCVTLKTRAAEINLNIHRTLHHTYCVRAATK